MVSFFPSSKTTTKTTEGKCSKRICCVCKETKLARDICISYNGEERCAPFIEAHNQCLASENFKV